MIDWAKEDDGTINREWTSVSDETVAFVQRYPLFCTLAEMRNGDATHPHTLAVTMDGSNYKGSLLVTADFGCVMFEAKK